MATARSEGTPDEPQFAMASDSSEKATAQEAKAPDTTIVHPGVEELAGTRLLFYRDETTGKFNENVILSPEPTNSPNDPLNWSMPRKVWHATLVLFITGFTAATSNDAGSAGDAQLHDLGIHYSVENTAAGVLFVGIGYWTLLASPMPTLYGRRLQYFVCLIWSIVGSVWFARTMTVSDNIWCQLFVGASEACAEALVQQSLSDLFFEHRRGLVLGLYVLATSIGTFLGPLVAGYIAIDHWRWVGWWCAIISAGTLVVFYFGLEETTFDRNVFLGHHHSVHHERDVGPAVVRDKDGKNAPNREDAMDIGPVDSETGQPIDEPKTYWQRIRIITPAPNLIGFGFKQYLGRLWHIMRVFTFPAVIFAGLQWGAQDAWLTFYLTVEEDNWYGPPWHYSNAQVNIMNIPTLIGAFIGCVYGGWFSDYFVQWFAKRYRNGISEAEDRLWLLLPSAIINPAGLMVFGIGSGQGRTWPMPYVGLGLIGFGWGCAGDLSMAYLMDAYPEMVLEGMVGVAVINNTLACVFTFTASESFRRPKTNRSNLTLTKQNRSLD
jgi:MFS family permease